MRLFPRKRADIDTTRLHEHDAVRDVGSRLVAAGESLVGPKGSAAFLFTSLREGQGTSTLAAAVARGLAESRRATLLAVVGDPGSGDLHPGSVSLKEFVDGARGVPAGAPLLTVRTPARFTDLPESAHDVRAWMEGFHFLIIDAPTVTDSLTRYWMPRVEGVVLVIDGEQVAVKSVVQARQDIERLGGRLVGVVLNRYRSRIPRWMAPYYVYG